MSCPRVLLLVCLSISFTGTNSGDDWYRWRGPNLNGVSVESDWSHDWENQSPKIAWRASVGTGFSSFVVKANKAITIGHINDQDVVTCFDVDSGEPHWTFSYAADLDDRDFEGGPTSTPTIDGSNAYVLSRAGDLYCLDLNSGDQRWHTQLVDEADVRLPGWGCSGAPLVVDDRVIVNLGESGIAINKHTGDLSWSSADRDGGYASPVPIDLDAPDTLVLASGRSIVGTEIESGQLLWSLRWLTSFNCNAADPIIHDGKLFVSSGYNRGSAMFDLASETPELVWKTKEMKNQIHGSILYNGHLYGIDGNMESGARLKCIQWSTGNVIWSVEDLHPGGLSVADGKLILLTESGELIIAPATPSGFSPVARGQVLNGKSWTVPVLSGGRIYCRSIEGEVVCVDCRE